MENAQLAEIDVEGFRRDLDLLRQRTLRSVDRRDLAHLRRVEWIGRAFTLLGVATAWLGVNPFSAFAIAFGITTRWGIAHHVAHGGYDRVPGVPARYTRAGFGKGWRRWLDWFDWIDLEAWTYEHNFLHHYHTSELADPDLVDRNFDWLRDPRVPRVLRYLVVIVAAFTWKPLYYAPNALNGLEAKRRHEKGAPHELFIHPGNFWDLRIPVVRRLWVGSIAPYVVFHFGLVPLLFLPLGTGAWLAVLINRLLAELITNVHTFAVIVPSHAGEDLMAFEEHFTKKDGFYLHQALCTANYRTGGDANDMLHMWINYQIEHHLFPDLPMLAYRRIQPEVAAICAAHGVPYVQESVFRRLAKLVAVCVGRSEVRRLEAVQRAQAATPARSA